MNYMNISGVDYGYDLGDYNDLPKWAKDEQLYNCELKDKLIFRRSINWFRQLSMFLF